MLQYLILVISFTLSFQPPPVHPSKIRNYESLLFQSIRDGYNPLARPVLNPKDPVHCNISIALIHVNEIEEKKQTISVNVWLHLMWKDESLKWDPEEFGNITEVRLDPSLIWTPDIHLYNKAHLDDDSSNSGGIQNSQYRAIVFHTGHVLVVPSVSLKATCPMHMTWFPFDTQTCTLKFGSWTYSKAQLDFRLSYLYENNPERTSPSFVENGEWEILSVSTERNEIYYPCCTEGYVNIMFKMVLKRRPLYYFVNLIIPCALIGFLALLGFTLPPNCKEKLTLGVTLLFSLILFLNIVSEAMPTISSSVPLMGVYFNCIMLVIMMSVVSTIIVNLRPEKELPLWVKVICVRCIRPITRLDPPPSLDNRRNRNQNCMTAKPMITLQGEDRIQVEWNFVALVVDRFCLILSLGVTAIVLTWTMLGSN